MANLFPAEILSTISSSGLLMNVCETDSSQKSRKSHKFSSENWDRIVSIMATTYRFTATERESFSQNKTAKLMAAIPFVAECAEAERTALAHLSVYLMASLGGREVFDHSKDDNKDFFARLRLIMCHSGGDEKVVRKGMALLGLMMLNGYKRDQSKDRASGEYNPLNDGSWDFETLNEKLLQEARVSDGNELTEILSEEDAIITVW